MISLGDLFSGIGGFSLAAHKLEIETKFFSEVNPYAIRVLQKNFPSIPNLGDISKISWNPNHYVDILTAGFPCQPHSIAGKRGASSDERDLWPETLKAIATIRPQFALLENVPGILSSERGNFFGAVLGDLAEIGYDCIWFVLPASDFGAIQIRNRIWIIAYPSGEREQGLRILRCIDEIRQGRTCGTKDLQYIADNPFQSYNSWATPLIRRTDNGISDWVDRIKALGNSIYPEVAYQILKILKNDLTPAE